MSAQHKKKITTVLWCISLIISSVRDFTSCFLPIFFDQSSGEAANYYLRICDSLMMARKNFWLFYIKRLDVLVIFRRTGVVWTSINYLFLGVTLWGFVQVLFHFCCFVCVCVAGNILKINCNWLAHLGVVDFWSTNESHKSLLQKTTK